MNKADRRQAHPWYRRLTGGYWNSKNYKRSTGRAIVSARLGLVSLPLEPKSAILVALKSSVNRRLTMTYLTLSDDEWA